MLKLVESVREDSMVNELVEVEPSSSPVPHPILKELAIDQTKCSPAGIEEVSMLLTDILQYPSTELAEIHSQANRLGITDLI